MRTLLGPPLGLGTGQPQLPAMRMPRSGLRPTAVRQHDGRLRVPARLHGAAL